MMNGDEHLQWCKDRAIDYLPNDPAQAVASMLSDMSKHPDTELSSHGLLAILGIREITNGSEAVKRWIEGFN